MKRGHHHRCPICGAQVECSLAKHSVGHERTIFVAGRPSTQRFKLCSACLRRYTKGMKAAVTGDLAVLAQLLEKEPRNQNPVDVLAEALLGDGGPGDALRNAVRQMHRSPSPELEAFVMGGRSKAERRENAVAYYLEALSNGERNVGSATMRKYPRAFQTSRALKQAVYRFRRGSRR